MTSIKVNFEIGHEASIRTKKTPEGFTHDWEVFVRGQEGADISHFVEKVVFHLHETFPKPKRVVKEPPFSIKESGYAGFIFPIEIYLKNRDEPKKIKFTYDLTLQQSGFLKDRYVFHNPNDDFKKKLLKGGGIIVNNNAFYTNPDQESRSRDSFSEEKPQLVSKPKLSSDIIKKHKSKEHKDEIPYRASSFENLFGAPIQKMSKVSPDPKKIAIPVKTEKKDKEKSSSSDKVKSKSEHKDSKPEKVKIREDKDKKPEKVKHKDGERSKDKPSKRPSERPPSPEPAKKKCPSPSPVRRPPSPPPRAPSSASASSAKDEYKMPKISNESFKQEKPKLEDKPTEAKQDKEKKKKEKKSHDRDKDRKEKKEHKRESHKIKEPPKELPKEPPKEAPRETKPRETPKEKEKEIIKEKPPKPEKSINKFSIDNLKKTPQDNEEKYDEHKSKEKSESERKHKHKKKDKKRDESRDKHKDSSKEKKHKHEKIREVPQEKPEPVVRRETPVPKERPPPPDPGSPISIDTASQCSSKSGLAKTSNAVEDLQSGHSDSEESVIAEEEMEAKIEILSPEPPKLPTPEPEPAPQHVPEAPPQLKEKVKKHKDKSSKREEKKRKRKAASEEDAESRKAAKPSDPPIKIESDVGESSGVATAETKVQDNGVSSSLGEDAETGEGGEGGEGELSPDYMVQLRGLQQRIMTIKSNEELERVVNLIAETGRYEVTTQTFDFDLCLLDRSTVLQLIQLVGC